MDRHPHVVLVSAFLSGTRFAPAKRSLPTGGPRTPAAPAVAGIVPGSRWSAGSPCATDSRQLTRTPHQRSALRKEKGQKEKGQTKRKNWLCPIEDRRLLDSSREVMLEGFPLGSYLLLVDYTGRMFREGKAVISGELFRILERLGSDAVALVVANGEAQQRPAARPLFRRKPRTIAWSGTRPGHASPCKPGRVRREVAGIEELASGLTVTPRWERVVRANAPAEPPAVGHRRAPARRSAPGSRRRRR